MTTQLYIVTPVRNAVRTIDATIWSIVSQAGDLDIHYHAQDGASTDGTLEKIQAWSARIERSSDLLPSRVHFSFESRPDGGMYEGIMAGFAKMDIPAGAFMGWCNADDALWPGALEAIAKLGQELPNVDWVMGWPTWYDDFNRFTAIERSPRFPQAILAAGLADGIHWPFVQQESTFWRKRLWDKAGGLNTSLRLAGDWDLWTRFARHTALSHAHRQLGAFYVRPGQQSANLDAYRAEIERILPLHARQDALRHRLRDGAALTSIPWVVQGTEGTWQLAARTCKPRANWVARVLKRLPTPAASKLLYRIW